MGKLVEMIDKASLHLKQARAVAAAVESVLPVVASAVTAHMKGGGAASKKDAPKKKKASKKTEHK